VFFTLSHESSTSRRSYAMASAATCAWDLIHIKKSLTSSWIPYKTCCCSLFASLLWAP
jgi:hypothetical protein